jgi:hypothetical protein
LGSMSNLPILLMCALSVGEGFGHKVTLEELPQAA